MRPGGHAGSRRKYRDSDFVLAVIAAAGAVDCHALLSVADEIEAQRVSTRRRPKFNSPSEPLRMA
jgi:hypothetical protein